MAHQALYVALFLLFCPLKPRLQSTLSEKATSMASDNGAIYEEFNPLETLKWITSLAEKDKRQPRDVRVPEGSFLKLIWALHFPFRTYTNIEPRVQFDITTEMPFPEYITFENRPKRSYMEECQSSKEDAIRQARKDRLIIYSKLENLLQLLGVNGRQCLLRTICEVAEVPFQESLLGEVLNALLSASFGVAENYMEEEENMKEYIEAELQGRRRMDCASRFRECEASIFDIIPNVEHRILD